MYGMNYLPINSSSNPNSNHGQYTIHSPITTALSTPLDAAKRPKRVSILASGSPVRPISLQRARSYDAVLFKDAAHRSIDEYSPALNNVPAAAARSPTASRPPAASALAALAADVSPTGSDPSASSLSTMPISLIDANRQRQGRLLLVSLLENFCQLYEQSPEHSRRLFFIICRALSHMGVIQQEYIDEMAPARSSYKRAFSELVAQAAIAIRQQQLPQAPDETRLLMSSAVEDAAMDLSRLDSPLRASPSTQAFSLDVTPSSGSEPRAPVILDGGAVSFTDLLDVHASRYRDDFEELRSLGRGGYGSVWHVRNKLDGCDYAVKKIRLSQNDDSFEKVLREIKSMPRLDHPYVVRYYGSWLEHAEYPKRRSRVSTPSRVQTHTRRSSSISRLSRSVPAFRTMDTGLRIDLLMGTTGEEDEDGDSELGLSDTLEEHSEFELSQDDDEEDEDDVVFFVSGDELDAADANDKPESQRRRLRGRHHYQNGTVESKSRLSYSMTTSMSATAYCSDSEEDQHDNRCSDHGHDHDHSDNFEDTEDEADLFDDEDSDDGGIAFSHDMPSRSGSRPVSHALPARWPTPGSLSTSFRSKHRRSHPGCGVSGSGGSSLRFPSSVEDIITYLSSPPNSPPSSHMRTFAPSLPTTSSRGGQRIAATERVLTLFIQMHLCSCTLKDYLRHRDDAVCNGHDRQDPLRYIDSIANVQLFRRIVEGVAYIHSQGLMHRDLKPSNIFIEFQDPSSTAPELDWLPRRAAYQQVDALIPKIGDFGLVAQMSTPPTSAQSTPAAIPRNTGYGQGRIFGQSAPAHPSHGFVSPSGMMSISRTSGVGTVTYAAPEQLATCSSAYDAKVDIYALGVIFLELCHPFATLMERATVLKRLREGVLPDAFLRQYPKEAVFVLWLTAKDPALRPTAQEILDFDLMRPDSMVNAPSWPIHVEMLRNENEELRQRIAELEDRLHGAHKCSHCHCGSSADNMAQAANGKRIATSEDVPCIGPR